MDAYVTWEERSEEERRQLAAAHERNAVLGMCRLKTSTQVCFAIGFLFIPFCSEQAGALFSFEAIKTWVASPDGQSTLLQTAVRQIGTSCAIFRWEALVRKMLV